MCSEARGRARARAYAVYARRFPAYARWLAGQELSEDQANLLKSYRFYRFLPGRFKILDEAEFGGAVFVSGTFRRTRPRPAERSGRPQAYLSALGNEFGVALPYAGVLRRFTVRTRECVR